MKRPARKTSSKKRRSSSRLGLPPAGHEDRAGRHLALGGDTILMALARWKKGDCQGAFKALTVSQRYIARASQDAKDGGNANQLRRAAKVERALKKATEIFGKSCVRRPKGKV
jgi:hypothetical protein